MIAHKTFSRGGVSFTHGCTCDKWERVRQQAEAFIAEEISEEDLVSITEAAVGANGPWVFSVTVWYRKG